MSALLLLRARAIQLEQPVGFGERRRPQYERVEHAEHRGVEPDTQRQREARHDRESRVAASCRNAKRNLPWQKVAGTFAPGSRRSAGGRHIAGVQLTCHAVDVRKPLGNQ